MVEGRSTAKNGFEKKMIPGYVADLATERNRQQKIITDSRSLRYIKQRGVEMIEADRSHDYSTEATK